MFTGLVVWVDISVLSEDKGLASLDGEKSPSLALGAVKSEGDFLGGLRLLSEDGSGLTSETLLLHVVPSLS